MVKFQLISNIKFSNFTPKHFFDYNNELLALFNESLVKFFSKKDFTIAFTINTGLNIYTIKKNKSEQILIFYENYIYFIEVKKDNQNTYDYDIIFKQNFISSPYIFDFDLNIFAFINKEFIYYCYPKYNYENRPFLSNDIKKEDLSFLKFLTFKDNIKYFIFLCLNFNNSVLYILENLQIKKLKAYTFYINYNNRHSSVSQLTRNYFGVIIESNLFIILNNHPSYDCISRIKIPEGINIFPLYDDNFYMIEYQYNSVIIYIYEEGRGYNLFKEIEKIPFELKQCRICIKTYNNNYIEQFLFIDDNSNLSLLQKL